MRAVVWTDTLQMIFIIIGMFTVAICGTHKVGGIEKLWDLAQKSGRIEFFNMDFDPTLRNTFWTVVVGKFIHQLRSYSTSQSYVQRCMSLPTRSKASWHCKLHKLHKQSVIMANNFIILKISARYLCISSLPPFFFR